MADESETFDNLVVWMISLANSTYLPNDEEISTGKPFAAALFVLDNEYFNKQWYGKIFDESIDGDTSWRLKALVLKRLTKSMIDYYENVARRSIAEFVQPDVQAAARDLSKCELNKILQLVVAVAINCPNRTNIIANISSFSESVQSSIMMAIQEIESDRKDGHEQFSLSHDRLIFERELENLHAQMDLVTRDKEDQAKRCADLENQISQLHDEKRILAEEKLQMESKFRHQLAAQQNDSEAPTKKVTVLSKRLEDAEEEIFRIEHVRDELKAKVETLMRENKDLQAKLGSSGQKDEDVQKMKDELDELRLRSVEFKKLEALLDTYKRKLDESNQLKSELKILQDKNSVFMNCAIDLEEEKRRNASLKTQVEAYRRRLDEADAGRTDETGRLEKAEEECKRLKEELNALLTDKQRCLDDKHTRRDLKEEMRLLGSENSIETLESRLKSKELELMTMEEKFKTALHAKDMELRSIDDRQKSAILCKDLEIKALEEKYKSYLAKAKTVITELENSNNVANSNGTTLSMVEFEGLRRELDEKDKIIHKLQDEQERMRIMREQEDRLMTTAFHGISMQLHRETVEKRLMSGGRPELRCPSSRTPQSFLARHRLVTSTKSSRHNSPSNSFGDSTVNRQPTNLSADKPGGSSTLQGGLRKTRGSNR